jgi:flagellar biosynthesis GTPase FlhF
MNTAQTVGIYMCLYILQVYETIDKTDPTAREQGRQEAREENARLVRQMEEELRQLREKELSSALQDVKFKNEEEAKAHAEKKMIKANLEAERIRKEKEVQETMAFHKLKGKLLAYEFGNQLSLRTFEAQGLDVSDMTRVLIAMFGPTGSGKTSFIGKKST